MALGPLRCRPSAVSCVPALLAVAEVIIIDRASLVNIMDIVLDCASFEESNDDTLKHHVPLVLLPSVCRAVVQLE
ncbi:hypothetical protein Cob_v002542 [Colletotrichum orbiculare MAFF 240422]|uniref:Uncharacterized protein n=1 Tax=Colletotrichum orbiculare (strain 104-T / ATCC 96160 / CBS 514.97 / LARS 414 / MAFF 240422) TaxID=1213857 RepID=A0A484G4I4_COLOR|nr:hypothetical protein Cob_v002542 [Colletotrichum orbiculare MAFF 240422]